MSLLISTIVYTDKKLALGNLLATVWVEQPSEDLVSAISAYPIESVNVGGSVPSGGLYEDQLLDFTERFLVTKTFNATSIGESAAMSEADAWLDYVTSQVVVAVGDIYDKVSVYDGDLVETSSLVTPS